MSVELHLWMIPAIVTAVQLIIAFWPTHPRGSNFGSAIGNAAALLFSGLLLIIGTLACWLVWALIALMWGIY